MPAPDVHISWEDKSDIPQAIIGVDATSADYPVYMVVASADKGPEEWKYELDLNDMTAYYGNTPSFVRHGQPLVQAYNAADAGARITFKRVVAEDATLANLGVVADVTTTQVPGKDPVTNATLYEDPITHNVTTVPQHDPSDGHELYHYVNKIDISFRLVSVVLNGNNPKAFGQTFYSAYKHTGTRGTNVDSYALFMILDNGRGFSNKRFRIYRDTGRSAPVEYVRYILEISETGYDDVLESLSFTMNPDIIEYDHNTSLNDVVQRKSKQVRAIFFDDEFKAFTENVSYLAGLEDNEYSYADALFGTDLWGNPYTYTAGEASITCSQTPVNLASIYGLQLVNGSDGMWAETAFGSSTYGNQVVDAFNGSYDDCIYDVDNVRIDAIFDANYPEMVKRAIEELVNFREDCVYLRDLGLNIKSIQDIKLAYSIQAISRSRFCATYISSYDMYDFYSRKQVSVTMMYHLARLFVNHFINGRNRPFCGIKYGITIPTQDIIEGSLNFAPKRTPAMDQKAELDTLRINYATYYEGTVLTVACEYTSQTRYTQLSYLNNVLSVQEVIKAIRIACPRHRYSFIDADSDDFAKYKEKIENEVITKYADRFKTCTIEYMTDDIYTLNKIIYATIKVQFKDFVQTEYFKILALL